MSETTRVTAEPIDLALHDPFEIALGTQTAAANVLVTIETDDGPVIRPEGPGHGITPAIRYNDRVPISRD